MESNEEKKNLIDNEHTNWFENYQSLSLVNSYGPFNKFILKCGENLNSSVIKNVYQEHSIISRESFLFCKLWLFSYFCLKQCF